MDFRFLGKFRFTIFLLNLSQDWIICCFFYFCHNDAKWQWPKCDGARYLKKKKKWANFVQKPSKNRVFWTFCLFDFSLFQTCCKSKSWASEKFTTSSFSLDYTSNTAQFQFEIEGTLLWKLQAITACPIPIIPLSLLADNSIVFSYHL